MSEADQGLMDTPVMPLAEDAQVSLSLTDRPQYCTHAKHFRVNITLRGHIRMETNTEVNVKRRGDWYSFFRPDTVLHWAAPVKETTYMLSFGWLK